MILLVNDDGFNAPGLQALKKAFAGLDEVWVVAPAAEASCISHAITLGRPIRVKRHGEREFAVYGTPSDAALIALEALLPRKPDLVVSGINLGYNLGTDVYYSGTVAAAREAAFAGVKALAVSIERERGEPRWELAAEAATKAVEFLERTKHLLWNLNVPNIPEVKGIRFARVGRRGYKDAVRHLEGEYYLISGTPEKEDAEGTDVWWVERGFAALSPLSVNPTAEEVLSSLPEEL